MEKYARQHAPEPVAGAERVAELEAEVSRLTALLIEQGHGDGCGSSRYYCSGCKTSFTDHWRLPAFGPHGECPENFEWSSYPCNCHLSTLTAKAGAPEESNATVQELRAAIDIPAIKERA